MTDDTIADEKAAIITGAGSGIGAATAKRFARDGYKVVLAGRTKDKLDAVASEIGEAALVQPCDISKEDDVAALIAATIKAFGRLDVLVNNAGVAAFAPISDLSLEDYDRQMTINARGTFMMVKEALPHLLRSTGSIVNVSSVSGLGGDWGGTGYTATKGAISLMTQSLALDLAQQGVRVNAVAPSLTETDMSEGIRDNEEVMETFRQRLPMGRGADPAEVADVIAFLASEDARFVNGAIIPVDGGLSASNGQPKLT